MLFGATRLGDPAELRPIGRMVPWHGAVHAAMGLRSFKSCAVRSWAGQWDGASLASATAAWIAAPKPARNYVASVISQACRRLG